MQSPEEELTSFEISSGLQIQLVALEPMIQDPVAIAFDEDGRLWVVEMRGFMADIDGGGEQERSGSIVVLEDTNEDELMDKRTVYIDSLIMPRAFALVSGGALIVESESLWLTQEFIGSTWCHSCSKVSSHYGFVIGSLARRYVHFFGVTYHLRNQQRLFRKSNYRFFKSIVKRAHLNCSRKQLRENRTFNCVGIHHWKMFA